MQGKRGLIMGVANDHSIAWGIAKTLSSHGATLAFTYQGEALGKRVKPLAESLGSTLVMPCDVEDIASVDAVFGAIEKQWGTLDFLRPRDRVLRQERAEGPLRRHHAREFLPHHGDLLLLLHRSRQARRQADAERRRDAHAHLQWRRARDAELQRHGGRQGGAGILGALSRGRFRPRAHPRQRDLGRPDPHARRRRHRRRARDVRVPAEAFAARPRRHAGGARRRRALSAVRPFRRRDRRNPFRGFRLQHHRDAASGCVEGGRGTAKAGDDHGTRKKTAGLSPGRCSSQSHA